MLLQFVFILSLKNYKILNMKDSIRKCYEISASLYLSKTPRILNQFKEMIEKGPFFITELYYLKNFKA